MKAFLNQGEARADAQPRCARAGCLHLGRQPDSESGRDGDERMMNDETKLHLTRRHFFSAASGGIGVAALASLLAQGSPSAEPGFARPAAFRAEGEARHLPVPVRRAVADRPVRLQAEADRRRAARSAGLRPQGTAADRHDRLPGEVSRRAVDFQVRAARHSRARGSARLLPHTAKIADEICIIRSMHTEAINHDPAVTFFQTGFQIAGRPSIGSWISLRTGQREPGSAGVRRDDLAGQREPAQPLVRPAVGQRLSADAATRA